MVTKARSAYFPQWLLFAEWSRSAAQTQAPHTNCIFQLCTCTRPAILVCYCQPFWRVAFFGVSLMDLLKNYYLTEFSELDSKKCTIIN